MQFLLVLAIRRRQRLTRTLGAERAIDVLPKQLGQLIPKPQMHVCPLAPVTRGSRIRMAPEKLDAPPPIVGHIGGP